MKIICDTKLLNEALNNVSRAVPSKTSIPALEGILIKTFENQISISAYDLSLGISTTIDAQVIESGQIILCSKIFCDMIRKMVDDSVTISCDEKLMTQILGRSTKFNILGIPADEYPELPKFDKMADINIPKDTLKTMINQTIFAVSQNEAKIAHTGSLFKYNLENNQLDVVSVDGFRLALRKETISCSSFESFIVPAKTLSEVIKILNDDEGEVSISVGTKHIVFEINSYTITSRLIEGEFLDYEKSIPVESNSSITVATRDFLSSLERVSLLITDKIKSPVVCKVFESKIELSCSSTIGNAIDYVDCQILGDDFEIAFNNKYMIDALKYCECDRIKISFVGNLQPLKITPVESDDLVYLVLPVRYKN